MQSYQFILVPRFSLVALSCAIDALRGANQILGREFYTWQTASVDGEAVVSTSTIPLQTTSLEENTNPDVLLVCGGDSSHNYQNTKLTNWLHDQAKLGKRIGSISDGAFVVAETGLFDRVASTIHWKCFDAYRERFPKLDIKASMMEIDAKRFSCAGGTSSLDLMLHFIREDHGRGLSSQIAQNYFHDTIRDSSREQHATNAFRLAARNPLLSDAMLLMEEHLEARMTIGEIAERLKISRRQLDRIFQREINQSPQVFYRDLRLSRAAGLLTQTVMTVSEIAVACGFQSASHLGKFFQQRYEATPGIYRRKHALANSP